jgi:integrase
MLKKADTLPEYFKLRAKAIVSLFRSGKRVGELAQLQKEDVKPEVTFLFITFRVEKKRRKNTYTSTFSKRYPLESEDAQHILNYKAWLNLHVPSCKWFFPSGRCVFGHYMIQPEKHLKRVQIWNIIKFLNPNAWCHLFREGRGASIVKEDERTKGEASLLTVFRVKEGLNLVREETALRYVRRYASEIISHEQEVVT